MSDIELLIKIPEKMYHMINADLYDYGDMNVIIRNGIPLPKGHGRLIDAEILDLENLYREDDNGFSLVYTESEFQTIIEADKGSEE